MTAPREKPATFSRRRAVSRETGSEPIEPRRLRPFFWGTLYVLVTTLAFAPTLTFRTAPVRAGSIATRDVVAPRDLIVPDPEATARRRTEAGAEVLPVYDFDGAAPAKFDSELRNSFSRARAAFARSGSRGEVTDDVRDAFHLPIGDEALAALARLGFSAAIEDRLAAIGRDLYRDGIVDNRELYQEGPNVLVRDTSTGSEHRQKSSPPAIEDGAPTGAGSW